MQAPIPLPLRPDVFTGMPTVGDLMGLCEESYRVMLRLAPELARLRGGYISSDAGGPDLLLEVREQARFTTIFRLTHLFSAPSDTGCWRPDPDALLRAYHDAELIEVLDLRQTALPLFNHYRSPALQAKWKANLFLSKWLSYCSARGYRFPPLPAQPPLHRSLELTPTP